jgi:hypothetical protein
MWWSLAIISEGEKYINSGASPPGHSSEYYTFRPHRQVPGYDTSLSDLLAIGRYSDEISDQTSVVRVVFRLYNKVEALGEGGWDLAGSKEQNMRDIHDI